MTKRLSTMLLFLVGILTGTWAQTLVQDADGYYIIGTVADWKSFAELVQTTPTANAKMTADIDLGDDQTVIGGVLNGSSLFYQGTFDGQGHTLTIAYNVKSGDGERFTTPFSLLQGATIRNLHLDGTVNSTYAYGGSVASILKGTNTIENVWNSVTSVCTMGGWVQMGGFIGVLDSGATTISDCLFTGSITHTGGYSGYFNGGYGPKPAVNNCLVLGTFNGEFGFNGNYTNCYCKHASTTGVTQPTDSDLSDGTTTTALNNGRTGDDAPWVQQGGQPMLKLFALQQDASGNYLIGSVQNWNDFATLVQTNPTVNARMTADIDLGDSQAMIGSPQPFSGTFDGQGHTLTVHLFIDTDGVAPFHHIDNATIKNLAVTGTVTGGIHSAGLVGGMPENSEFNLISNVMVSATVTTTGSHCGGILGHGGSTTNTTIQDCLFNGTINGKEGGSTIGVIWGWQTYGHANITSCLENGTFTNHSSFDPLFRTYKGSAIVSNSYYVTGSSSYGTQATMTTLGDGTVTDGLNNGRTGDDAPWVQEGSLPMLKLFVAGYILGDANGNGVVDIADGVEIVNYILNNPSADFNVSAADVDGDGEITIADAVGVMNIIMNP